jgi:hypothetical protein
MKQLALYLYFVVPAPLFASLLCVASLHTALVPPSPFSHTLVSKMTSFLAFPHLTLAPPSLFWMDGRLC